MSNSSPPGDGRGSVDRRIAALADGQHRVVSHAQLRALGMPEGQIRYRIQVGRLYRVEQCAYAVGHRAVTIKGRWLACVFTCGDGARLGYRSAAALWAIAPYSGPLIDVIAPRRRRSRRNLVVHTARLDPLDVTIEDAIPVTTVARTLVDLAAIADVRRIERALTRAEKLELFDPAQDQGDLRARSRAPRTEEPQPGPCPLRAQRRDALRFRTRSPRPLPGLRAPAAPCQLTR
jgi:predicted transcriptional regulator of viral defense system